MLYIDFHFAGNSTFSILLEKYCINLTIWKYFPIMCCLYLKYHKIKFNNPNEYIYTNFVVKFFKSIFLQFLLFLH